MAVPTLVGPDDDYPYGNHWHYPMGSLIPTGSFPTITTQFSDQESMSDVLGNACGYNTITHTKDFPIRVNSVGAEAGPASQPDPWNSSWYGKKMYSKVGTLSGLYSPIKHWTNGTTYPTVSLPSIDWDALVEDVGSRLDGSMTASTNILVFLAEIAQTIRMFKDPAGLIRLQKSLRAARKTRETLRTLVKGASSAWLEGRYGWRLLDRDITNFVKSWPEVQAHIDFLQQTKETFVPISAVQKDSTNYSLPYPVITFSDSYSSATCYSASVERTARFSLEIMRGKAFEVLSRWEYIKQRTGQNDLVSALWDYLPMSFVVDWFIDIQSFLERDPIFWDRHNLRRMGYSVKLVYKCCVKFYTITWAQQLSPPYVLQDESLVDYNVPQIVHKVYTRTPGFPPDTDTVGLFGGLNMIHLADGSALIVQRML